MWLKHATGSFFHCPSSGGFRAACLQRLLWVGWTAEKPGGARSREKALRALREGFTLTPSGAMWDQLRDAKKVDKLEELSLGCLDTTPSLQLFTPSELARLVGGKSQLSTAELLGVIEWSESEWGESKGDQGFTGDAAPIPGWLKSVLSDASVFNSERRLHFFQWVTGRRALPDASANMPGCLVWSR